MERRLRQPSLPAMQLALGSEQALAEERLGRLEPLVLDEAARPPHQDVLDQVGLSHQPDVPGTHAIVHEAAVLAAEPGKETERVAAHAEEAPQAELVRRSSREVCRGGECGDARHRRVALARS